MSLPAAWVENLFSRLAVRYGAAFMRQYDGLDAEMVRADWADVLDGFDGPSIAYALRYLSADRPPTALQFRDNCRRAPEPTPIALIGADIPPADPVRLAAMVERAMSKSQQRAGKTAAEFCVQRIDAIAKERGLMSTAQRHVRHCCLSVGADSREMQSDTFNPIPKEQWPWNQIETETYAEAEA